MKSVINNPKRRTKLQYDPLTRKLQETWKRIDEVTKDEHEANMRRAMSSQGITTRKLSPDDLEHREAVKQWALEHQHEGFDAYDILYLGPEYTAVYNTREPDPETGVLGAYYIIQQDIFVSPEEVRKLQGK